MITLYGHPVVYAKLANCSRKSLASKRKVRNANCCDLVIDKAFKVTVIFSV